MLRSTRSTNNPSPPPYFFFNDTATTEIYTLSLHDALPISQASDSLRADSLRARYMLPRPAVQSTSPILTRSEEHTSELQSRVDLVCRLLLDKKKINHKDPHIKKNKKNKKKY